MHVAHKRFLSEIISMLHSKWRSSISVNDEVESERKSVTLYIICNYNLLLCHAASWYTRPHLFHIQTYTYKFNYTQNIMCNW